MVQMPVRYNRELPVGVLAAYAVALLANPSLHWHKHVKVCKYSKCGQAFIAPLTGGRRTDYHDECRRLARNAYMTSGRRKGKSAK
jgi:hypothetical protein